MPARVVLIGSIVAQIRVKRSLMKTCEVEVLPASGVRRALTSAGDIRADISFQNDINNLLARIEESQLPWTAAFRLSSLGAAVTPVAQPRRNSVTPPLRVFDGGGAIPGAAARLGEGTTRPLKPQPAARRMRRRA
jgi:hypothetical protein